MGDAKWTKEQELVINLRDRNILVSAAAGSGKTAVLVERIIQIISDRSRPVDIDRLLVVTFTKAAASEMRSRVGDAIERMLLDSPDDEHLQRQATLLHNAQITTIDSFCQNIIRNYFHVIDLDPSFKQILWRNFWKAGIRNAGKQITRISLILQRVFHLEGLTAI